MCWIIASCETQSDDRAILEASVIEFLHYKARRGKVGDRLLFFDALFKIRITEL